MSERVVYPVIDLLGGRVVRALRNGDGGLTLVDEDPIAIALRWRDQGAQWLRLVDLDGARDGAPRQLEVIHALIAAVGLPVQVAGGLRDAASVAAALEAGAASAVLSAATPDDQALVAECAARWGERVAVALEARDGRVTVAGWLPSDAASAMDVARAMRYLGVSTLIVTSVASAAPDPLPGALRRALPDMRLIAGGALSSLDDLRGLLARGMDGALLGRALYNGQFTLEQALAAAREAPAYLPTSEPSADAPDSDCDSGVAEEASAARPAPAAEAEGTGPERPESAPGVTAVADIQEPPAPVATQSASVVEPLAEESVGEADAASEP